MKKGFTLIELLAVILILGIIALIAIPTVNNIINEAKENATKRSAEQYIKTVEEYAALELMKGNIITSFSVGDADLSIKGTLPTSGNLLLNNGEVISASLEYTDFTAAYDGNEVTITKGLSNDITTLSNTKWRMNDTITGYTDIFPLYELSGDITDCIEFGEFTMTGYVNGESVGSNTSYALAFSVFYGTSVFVEYVGHNDAYFVYIPENSLNYPTGWYYGDYTDMVVGGLSSLAKADYIEISFGPESNLDSNIHIEDLATTKSNLKSSTYINWFLANATQIK